MADPVLEELVQRVAVLERDNRRLRRLGVAALLVLGALGVLAQARPRLPVAAAAPAGAREVEVERLILRDAAGRLGATLGWQADRSPALTLYGADGRTARVTLTVGADDAPGLALFDAAGRPRATLALFRAEAAPAGSGARDPSPALALYDATGRARAALTAAGDAARLDLADRTGEPRAVLRARADGEPALELRDGEGRPRAGVALLADNTPAFNLYARDGKARVAFATVPSGAARLALADAAGRVLWSAP
jgi:hypothetical protein